MHNNTYTVALIHTTIVKNKSLVPTPIQSYAQVSEWNKACPISLKMEPTHLCFHQYMHTPSINADKTSPCKIKYYDLIKVLN